MIEQDFFLNSRITKLEEKVKFDLTYMRAIAFDPFIESIPWTLVFLTKMNHQKTLLPY